MFKFSFKPGLEEAQELLKDITYFINMIADTERSKKEYTEKSNYYNEKLKSCKVGSSDYTAYGKLCCEYDEKVIDCCFEIEHMERQLKKLSKKLSKIVY